MKNCHKRDCGTFFWARAKSLSLREICNEESVLLEKRIFLPAKSTKDWLQPGVRPFPVHSLTS